MLFRSSSFDNRLAAQCRAALAAQPDGDGLRTVTSELLRAEVDARRRLIDAVRSSALDPEIVARTAMLDDCYPGDAGVLVSLLLNAVQLQSGEALFLGPGNMHAYLRGTGIEVMANSDNVLRGGLTPKHIDVDELLHILDPRPGELGRVQPIDENNGAMTRWPVPVDDFELLRASPAGRTLPIRVQGPSVFLCTNGESTVSSEHGSVHLVRGAAAVAPATDTVTVDGDGVVFLARVGRV